LLHIAGVTLLVGNITVTAGWKVFADRTRDPSIVAFGQRIVTGTDIGLALPGIALTMIGGYSAMLETGYGFPGPGWLVWGQVCFVVAGLIWLGVLVPIQFRQARMAETFKDLVAVIDAYRRLARDWLIWGLIATVPMVAALYLMSAKPIAAWGPRLAGDRIKEQGSPADMIALGETCKYRLPAGERQTQWGLMRLLPGTP
jgi:uncharacterized membrane protein